MAARHQAGVPVLEALDALYAELPSVDCTGRCFHSCSFIAMTDTERQRIVAAGGPAIVAMQPRCPALDWSGRCSVYDLRPMICRLYGVTEGMECPYGCRPERMLTREEGYEYLARAMEVTGGVR